MTTHRLPGTLSPLGAERRRRPLVSLTPLIDVVFILLVFFMLASSFLDWRAIDVSAGAGGTAAPSPRGALLVELRADGGLRLGGESLSADALSERIAARLARNPDQRVLVKPRPGVPLQNAIDLLERLTGAGVRDVSFIRDGAR